jgi:guanylate kinase
MERGVLLIVCGPSGVGKTSLGRRLLAANEQLTLSVSYTTRARRGQEVDGEAYHFVDEKSFKEMRDREAFAEWAEVHGNFYGTPTSAIEEAWRADQDVLFDIDYQGARQLKERYPEATAVLVTPPDMKTLEGRLRGRGTDSEEVIRGRLAKARHELEQYELFDFIVENGEFERAVQVMQSIYTAARHARHVRAEWLEKLLS